MVKKFFLIVALVLSTAIVHVQAADLPFDVLAIADENSSREMLALIRMKSDGEIYIMPTAELPDGNGELALVPFVPEVYNFHLRKDEYGDPPPLIFMMLLPNEKHGLPDEALGEWRDGVHVIPVYALFEVNGEQIICQKPFYSATSMEATHFQATIQDPLHTRLIEVFMTQMPHLHQAVQANGIKLQ